MDVTKLKEGRSEKKIRICKKKMFYLSIIYI